MSMVVIEKHFISIRELQIADVLRGNRAKKAHGFALTLEFAMYCLGAMVLLGVMVVGGMYLVKRSKTTAAMTEMDQLRTQIITYESTAASATTFNGDDLSALQEEYDDIAGQHVEALVPNTGKWKNGIVDPWGHAYSVEEIDGNRYIVSQGAGNGETIKLLLQ